MEFGDNDYSDVYDQEPIDIYEGSDEQSCTWHYMLIAFVVVAIIILLYFREKFKVPGALANGNLPFNSGSRLRQQSLFSGTNQGMNDLPDY